MRDIDPYNRTSILENAKNQIQHNCRSLVLLRILQKLPKSTEYFYKIYKRS